jgi:hypothetical protein
MSLTSFSQGIRDQKHMIFSNHIKEKMGIIGDEGHTTQNPHKTRKNKDQHKKCETKNIPLSIIFQKMKLQVQNYNAIALWARFTTSKSTHKIKLIIWGHNPHYWSHLLHSLLNPIYFTQ